MATKTDIGPAITDYNAVELTRPVLNQAEEREKAEVLVGPRISFGQTA